MRAGWSPLPPACLPAGPWVRTGIGHNPCPRPIVMCLLPRHKRNSLALRRALRLALSLAREVVTMSRVKTALHAHLGQQRPRQGWWVKQAAFPPSVVATGFRIPACPMALGGGGRPLLKGRGGLPKGHTTPCLMPLLAPQPPATAPPTSNSCSQPLCESPATAIATAPGSP